MAQLVYKHALDETHCDSCAKRVAAPVYTKAKDGFFLWFFCGPVCQDLFFKLHGYEVITLH